FRQFAERAQPPGDRGNLWASRAPGRPRRNAFPALLEADPARDVVRSRRGRPRILGRAGITRPTWSADHFHPHSAPTYPMYHKQNIEFACISTQANPIVHYIWPV